MPGPFDYTVQQPDIAGSLLGGIAAGQQLGAQRDAKIQVEQYSSDLQGTLANPTPQAFSALIAKYPKQREAFKDSWEILNKDQQDQQFGAGTQAYSAIQNGKPDVAVDIIDKQISAMENSGQDPKNLVRIKEAIQNDPNGAGSSIALTLSSLEPERWGKIATEMRASELAPSNLTESQAKAAKAATDAKFAESSAVQDLAKGGWEISKLQNDIGISRQNAQIAAMNAATARFDSGTKSESNALKRDALQLKIDDKIRLRDAAVSEKAATVNSGRAVIDNMLNTTERFLNTPGDVLESAAGPISSRAPTLSQDTADLEELVTTMSSQAFMAQIPALKGMGALSNAEGEKLQASLQNLSLRQSPKRLVENVKEVQRLMGDARKNLSTKYGVPDVVPDTPAAAPSPSGIEALLQKYGGQ